MTDEEIQVIADLATRVLNRLELFDGQIRRLSSSLEQLHRDHADIRATLKELREDRKSRTAGDEPCPASQA